MFNCQNCDAQYISMTIVIIETTFSTAEYVHSLIGTHTLFNKLDLVLKITHLEKLFQPAAIAFQQ